MTAPNFAELLVVAIGFGIVGLYILIVDRIVRSGEKPSPEEKHDTDDSGEPQRCRSHEQSQLEQTT